MIDNNLNINILQDILLTYSFYNFHFRYCQVIMEIGVTILLIVIAIII